MTRSTACSSSLNPEELESSFISWTHSVSELTDNEIISIDGKSMHGMREYGSKSIMHMVSTQASEKHIVLGRLKVDEKSNEITTIPKLLDLLVIKGCIVTIDAMGCQKDIVSAIARKEADLINRLVCSHWGVENSLHWVLDVAFNEDHSRKRSEKAAQNFSLINRIALNLLKNEKSAKVGVGGKDSKPHGTMITC